MSKVYEQIEDNPQEKVIEHPHDYRLDLIANFGEIATNMSTASQGRHVKQLTKDTSRAMHHTCNGVKQETRPTAREMGYTSSKSVEPQKTVYS